MKTSCTKGIILAGGTGSRLYPLTHIINKQLLPLYDKPIIYYSLTTLMLSGIQDILIISREEDLLSFKHLLRDGSQWGIKIQYAIQNKPGGLPEAFIIGEQFIGTDPVALILGDNIFHGQGLSSLLYEVTQNVVGANLFAFGVNDPERYGVLVFNEEGRVIDIEEKPVIPKSKQVVTGLYFYDGTVVNIAKTLKPSKRGELEITDLNRIYVKNNNAKVRSLGRGYVWFDVGTPKAMYQAADYIQVVQTRQGIGIACPEEVAWRMGYISDQQLKGLIAQLPNSHYSSYISSLIKEEEFIFE